MDQPPRPDPLPTSPEALLTRLEALGIAHKSFSHAPVFTVAEAKALRGNLGGLHIKNLFLRNKKGRMWLVTCLEDRALDLKALGILLGSGRPSFVSPERLMTYLGVLPGAVTPMAVINDGAGAVQVVLDQDLLAGPPVNVHPLVNSMTTTLAPGDLLRFLEACGHPPQIMDLSSALKTDSSR